MIFSFQDTQAQSLRERMKKAIFKESEEEKTEEASGTEDEEAGEESPGTRFGNQAIMNAMGLTGNATYEDVYNFDAYIQMELTTFKKNGKLDDQVVYDNYLHKEAADYAMVFRDKGDQSTIIFDTKNYTMLVLSDSDGEKAGFATTVDPEALAEQLEDYEEEETSTDMDSYKPVKTGRTKTILGYSCDEYMVEDEGSKVSMWVSEKLGREVRKEWMGNQQTFGTMFVHAQSMNGAVLEYDVVDQDGSRSVMQVTKIDLNHSHKVDTQDYTIISMGMQGGEE